MRRGQRPASAEQNQLEDLRAIPRWVRIYAQNRSLGVVVSLLVFVLLALAIGGFSYLADKAYRDGQMVLLGACIAALVPILAAVIYLSVPWWGGRLLERVTMRLYAVEGNARPWRFRGERGGGQECFWWGLSAFRRARLSLSVCLAISRSSTCCPFRRYTLFLSW